MSHSVFVLLAFINKWFPPHIHIVLYWLWAGIATVLHFFLLLFVYCVEILSRHIRQIEKVNIDFITGLNQEHRKKAWYSPPWLDQRVQFLNVFILNQMYERACLHQTNTCLRWSHQHYKARNPGINEVQNIFSHYCARMWPYFICDLKCIG